MPADTAGHCKREHKESLEANKKNKDRDLGRSVFCFIIVETNKHVREGSRYAHAQFALHEKVALVRAPKVVTTKQLPA